MSGANKDEPDLSWKDWVTEPRHGAVQARRETRALWSERRPSLALKYASGMTSTRWRAAAHGATGRLHSRFAGNAPRRRRVSRVSWTRASASVGRCRKRLVP